MLINSSTLKPGIDAAFSIAYAGMLTRDYLKAFSTIFMEVPSTGAQNEYAWLGDVPGVREWIGDKSLAGLKDYDYVIKNKDYYSGFAIDRNELEDEQLPAILPRVAMLGEDVAKWPLELAINALKMGQTGLAFDGKPFFSDRGTNDNLLSGTGISAAQIKADITTARTTMMKFVSDTGKKLGLQMDTIVCPPELEALFLEACTSVVGETAARPAAGWIKNVVVAPELTDSSDWYGLCTSNAIRPIIVQKRKDVTTVLDDSEVKKSKKLSYSAEMRGNAGYGF